jgi:hypothetical protein
LALSLAYPSGEERGHLGLEEGEGEDSTLVSRGELEEFIWLPYTVVDLGYFINNRAPTGMDKKKARFVVSMHLYIRDAPRNRKSVAVGTKVLSFLSRHAIDKAY